ncbi:hypothetical protein [Methanopyrus sp. KOL6]|uniref:hypothetical protein n=1 Tax=Methanopyrus sp. KOL6 TaxID=1937004 RepID=UPI000B4A5D3D|nr:hypothetical protein [Methanopyrus sp. KOL6]
MIPIGERGFLFTPAAALSLALLLLSVSYLSYHGRESGYLIRCEYIKPVINEAILSMTHQQLSRAVYLGVVDFLNGAKLPGGEKNGYRYGRIAVHQGGSNIEWVAPPTGLVAPYKIVDVGPLNGSYDSYRTVIESLRYYIDYELAKLAVDVHDSIKRTQGADVWIVPRCYAGHGEWLYWDWSDPEHPKVMLSQYVPSNPSDISKTPIVPDAHDPFTIYVHLDIHLMAQIPGWEVLDIDLGETTVQASIQGYAPYGNENRAVFDPLPIWAYYASKYRWSDNSPLKFKPMMVIGNYQVAVGQGGSIGGESVGEPDVIRFYSAYLNEVNGDGGNSTNDEDKLRLAHVLSVPGKMLPWDDTRLLDKNEVDGEVESQWVILPYFPIREGVLSNDVGRPPNFIERAAGILYVLPSDRVVSVDGIHDSGVEAIEDCKAGMETMIPTLPAEEVDVWAHGPFGTVDWMAWMEVLASRSGELRGVIDGVRASEFGIPERYEDQGEPMRIFRLYGFNSDDPMVKNINSVLSGTGLQLATDSDRRRGFALPGADILKWFLLPGTNEDMVLKNDKVIRIWP